MKVFNHHIYEYKKGLRNLILHTACTNQYEDIKARLEKSNISYHVYKFSSTKINIFFGDNDCVEIIRNIKKAKLSDYTPEEDFILGTMLGYSRSQQCSRYLKLKNKGNDNSVL
jgi:hypothetical protein